MDKKRLIEHICALLEKDLRAMKSAAKESHKAAISEESKPENQYDTRALEASYLAGAQAHRVREIETLIAAYKFLEIKNFNKETPIGATAFVELDLDGKKSFVFMVPAGGGQTVSFNSQSIQILTPKSPLGEALVGLKTGDLAVVERASKEGTLSKEMLAREYEILSVQ